MGGVTKFIGGGIILMLLISTLIILAVRGCLSEYDERSALPPVTYVEKDGNAVLFSIVQFEQTDSYSQNGGMVQRSVTDEFYIQTNDAVTGKKIKSKQIKFNSDIRQFPREVIGVSDGTAWIFINQLMAYDAFTLEKVGDIATIEEKNPSLKGRLPVERSFYEFNNTTKNIRFIATDGSPWSLDTKTLIASPAEEKIVTTVSSQLEEAMNKIKEMNKMNIHFSQIKINQDTLNGNWFGIYTPEEFRTVNDRVTIGTLYGDNTRRQLVTSVYDSVKDYQRFVINRKKATAVTNAGYFLEGGFLIDKETGTSFHLANPEGTLVVYKDQVGRDGKIIVSRLTPEGKVLWKYDTGLLQWIDWKCKNDRLYIYGCNRKELSSSQCNLLLIINMNDGAIKGYDYFTDKEF